MWIDPFNKSAGESLPKPRLFSYRFISVCLRNHSREGRCVQMHQKRIPLRMCAGCGESKPKKELVRVVRSPEGEISLDLTGKKPGRGAYVCKSADCLRAARKARRLERAFSCQIPAEVYDRMEEEIGKGMKTTSGFCPFWDWRGGQTGSHWATIPPRKRCEKARRAWCCWQRTSLSTPQEAFGLRRRKPGWTS